MCFTKRLTFLFVFLWFHVANAQDNFTGFLQPQFALNYKVTQLYAHNFSLTQRSFWFEDDAFRLRTRQIDVAHFSKLIIRDNKDVALGIQYRFRAAFDDGEDELRLTQQFNSTARPLVVRFGHRFRSEQRITQSQTVHRFRYRFALDFPLKGEKLDLGEPYFVGGFENLLSVSNSSIPQYDTRLTGQLGWRLEDGVKLQFGLEYRCEDYTSEVPQNVVFLLTSVQWAL